MSYDEIEDYFGEDSKPKDGVVEANLVCGGRKIVGKEYRQLVEYNERLRSTQLGEVLFRKILTQYAFLDDSYEEITLNFSTEEKLKKFKEECRMYLKIPDSEPMY